MLQEWAAIAQIIGVTMQGIDFATTRTSKKRKSPISEEMQALVGLKHPLVAWKQLHIGYSTLQHSFERIYSELSNSNGTAKRADEILPRDLHNAIDTPEIYSALFNFDEEVGVAVAQLRQIQKIRIVKEEDYLRIGQSCRAIPDLANILQTINHALDNALKTHDMFLEFSNIARKYVAKEVWDINDVRFFLNNRQFIHNLVHTMQKYTDAALMALLSINVALVNEMETIISMS